MRQFRVVLRGPQGHSPERGPSVPAGPSLRADLAGLGSCAPWFRPEAVRVHLARSPKAYAPPGDWELPLVPRAAAVTLAAAGVLGALSGGAEASPRLVPAPPPSLASSSARTFMPTDRSPEVVLLEARQVRLQDSFRYTPGPALTDARGNPILIAAYHSNTTSPHSNSAGTPHVNMAERPHGNLPWYNHSNLPGGHANGAWENHANAASGAVHTNMIQGDYVF